MLADVANGGFPWGMVILGSLLGTIVLYVIVAWLLYRIGKKLNYDRPWFAWIPYANLYMLVDLSEKDTVSWFVIILFFSIFCFIVALVMGIMVWMDIAEKCGKERWWGILILVPIVNLVVMLVLGSGTAVPPQPPAAAYPGQPGQNGQPPQGPPPPPAR